METELQQGTPEVQNKQPECHVQLYICNAVGSKMNFRSLLVQFCCATHICNNGNCTSIYGTPRVHRMFGAEFFEASSLVCWVFNPEHFIG
jgi:hypothetical protein